MEWIRGPTIGRGTTAAVSLASAANLPGRPFAVKSAELSHSLPLQREQSILSKLSSPYIVNYLGFDITKENGKFLYNLWMEYLPSGTLQELIVKHGGFLDEPTIRSFTARIAEGLSYLHGNGIAHCDLKAQNVLIGEDGLKIADFGCAKLIGGNPSQGGFLGFWGTPMFMAPEVARGEEQGLGADVWALGCLIIEMATGVSPWSGAPDPMSLLYRICFSEDVPEIPAWLPDDARDFLDKCLRRDPRQRWTVEQLLSHPFVYGSGCRAKVDVLNADSPIAVLDRGFWDLAEVMASELDLESSPDIGSCIEINSASAGERIKNLNGDTGSIAQVVPDWTDMVDWFTIRSHDQERPEWSSIHEVMEERPLTSTDVEAELQLPMVPSDSLYQLLSHEENSIVTTSNANFVSTIDYNEVAYDGFGSMDRNFKTDKVEINIHELEQ